MRSRFTAAGQFSMMVNGLASDSIRLEYQEALAVARHRELVEVGLDGNPRRKEDSWYAGFRSRAGFERHRHHVAVEREVEQLLAVFAPAALHAAFVRNLAAGREGA